MELMAGHWAYLIGMITIIVVMIYRKNVVVPAVAATFLTTWLFTGSFIKGLVSIFMASMTAASELFSIFLIIALITALLGALRAMGADRKLVLPFQKLMRNGTTSFLVLFAATYFISLFFWPTPAVPLIGAILLPVAIRAGLPAMGGAMIIAIAGQGMALSSDYVIQVAPGMSAVAAGVSTAEVADRAFVLSLVTGLVAIVVTYLKIRRKIVAPDQALLDAWENSTDDADQKIREASLEHTSLANTEAGSGATAATESRTAVATHSGGAHEHRAIPASGRTGAPDVAYDEDSRLPNFPERKSTIMAILTMVSFAGVIGYMMLGKFTDLVPEATGSEAAGIVGGTAALLMLIGAVMMDGRESLETCAEHVVDGLVFAFKAMGVVLPIAGFFFIGNADFAARIMGLGEDAQAPGFLFDLVASVQDVIPNVPIVMGLGILAIGMATGLDGSGFSGLPLTGSLSGALGPASGVDPATLAAIGQLGGIWTGGGTLIAWSSLLAVAGFARVNVLELARQLFFPVVLGLVVAAVVGVLIF